MPSLDDLIALADKKYGVGMLVRGSDLKGGLQRCTTGSLAFDLMLGGGWPLNAWNELIGNESAGKTVAALKTIAANQALDSEFETLWVAAEVLPMEWAESLGVDLKRIGVLTTTVMEEAYQSVIDALDERAVDAVVIDSYPALVPSAEDEKTMMEVGMGLGARLTGQFMRKSNKAGRRSLISEDRPCLGLLINQWRDKIGVLYGDPRTTPGGRAKNFAAFTRVEFAREDWIEAPGPTKVGMTIKARTIKNKTAPPQRTGQVDFYFQDHLPFHTGDYDSLKEISNIAVALDIMERKGAWYHYNGEKWNGKDGVTQALREDLDLQENIRQEVYSLVLKLPPVTQVSKAKPKPPASTTTRKLKR